MATSNLPDPSGLTIQDRANAIVKNELQPWADAMTASSKLAYDDAVAVSKQTGQPYPKGYTVWGVNAPLVLAIEQGLASGASTLFTQTLVTMPVPTQSVPDLFIDTDPSITGLPGLFEAKSGDGPQIPVGTKHSQDGHDYIKIGPHGYEFASPYPDKGIYLWNQVS